MGIDPVIQLRGGRETRGENPRLGILQPVNRGDLPDVEAIMEFGCPKPRLASLTPIRPLCVESYQRASEKRIAAVSDCRILIRPNQRTWGLARDLQNSSSAAYGGHPVGHPVIMKSGNYTGSVRISPIMGIGGISLGPNRAAMRTTTTCSLKCVDDMVKSVTDSSPEITVAQVVLSSIRRSPLEFGEMYYR
ncbi:hypothetical protein ACRALDRAFT_2018367 [Sodiomyces alcalophilus JCM 7366]|uniref:uncharacterized protein n=1 Tax=Sodiomyces alcalophilus JCM 7366 TaxID=591952 RepID=UPI0039B56D7A